MDRDGDAAGPDCPALVFEHGVLASRDASMGAHCRPLDSEEGEGSVDDCAFEVGAFRGFFNGCLGIAEGAFLENLSLSVSFLPVHSIACSKFPEFSVDDPGLEVAWDAASSVPEPLPRLPVHPKSIACDDGQHGAWNLEGVPLLPGVLFHPGLDLGIGH